MTLLNSTVVFKNNNYHVNNSKAPAFIRVMEFSDEYQANLAYALWLEFIKSRGGKNVISAEDISNFKSLLSLTIRMTIVHSDKSKSLGEKLIGELTDK